MNISDNELILYLKDYYNKYGIPTTRDLNKNKEYPSSYIYRKRFGNFKNALDLAGIKDIKKERMYNRKSYSSEELLEIFKKEVYNSININNSLLTYNDVDNNKNMPSMGAFLRKFGTIDKMYELIGIDKNKFNNDKLEEDMKKKYIEIRSILKRTPTSRDLNDFSKKSDNYYAAVTYINHFKSIEDFQKIMGDNIRNVAKEMTKADMLNALIKLSKDLGISPTQKDLKICPYTPSLSTYRREFGNFVNALVKAGLKSRSNKENLITPNGNKALSGYEYKFLLMLEKYNIKFSKENMYSEYISNFNKKYRFDFIVNINEDKYFIEIFGIEGSEKYDKKVKEKINLCKINNLKLIPLYGEDICFKNIDEINNEIMRKIHEFK